ncbi:MAG: hypothetical protein ACK56I_33190, partial [bacterium]
VQLRAQRPSRELHAPSHAHPAGRVQRQVQRHLAVPREHRVHPRRREQRLERNLHPEHPVRGALSRDGTDANGRPRRHVEREPLSPRERPATAQPATRDPGVTRRGVARERELRRTNKRHGDLARASDGRD